MPKVSFRLSESELSLLDSIASSRGISRTELILDHLFLSPTLEQNATDLPSRSPLRYRQAIATAANRALTILQEGLETGELGKAEIDQIFDNLTKILRLCNQ